MSYKVWLLCIFICCFLCGGCADGMEQTVPVSAVPSTQDTLEMKPDFSYVVTEQIPHIIVDQSGYRGKDKKVAFFYGNGINESFEVRENEADRVVYTGTLVKVKETEGKILYTGVFTGFAQEGDYYIHHEQLGDSHDFTIDDELYDKRYKELENKLLKEEYKDVGIQAYFLANYMFIHELEPDKWIDESYIKTKLQMLLEVQDAKTGAFYKEVKDKMEMETVQEAVSRQGETIVPAETQGTVSLSATAQMAGVFAQYVYLYKHTDDPAFINQCLLAAGKAYKYVEKYRDNTDTDAWYYAATQLYRTTSQYKYRTAIAEYDTLPVESRSSTELGYTILADFTYLSTPYGTDYNRCAVLLDSYMDKAQNISVSSSRENFYVLEEITSMSDKEILEDMFIMGVVNYVLSGQEYAGVQKNYIHYLSGVNTEMKDYLNENILMEDGADCMDAANAVKMLVVYANLCDKENIDIE